MRDLLYLSETKMQALLPQLPRKIRKRLGLEAGLTAGIFSVRATLPAEQQASIIELLDPVIKMIESERLSRWRTDPKLQVGDWIQFEEEFGYGEAMTTINPSWDDYSRLANDLVFFAAENRRDKMFLLCGSRAHVLDKRQRPSLDRDTWVSFYTTALLDYACRVARLPDEAAVTEPPGLGVPWNRYGAPFDYAIIYLFRSNFPWPGRAQLSGHARVLALDERFVLATPLYVEYTTGS